MKHVWPALKVYFVLSVLLGLIYPLTMTAVGRGLFRDRTAGSLIRRGDAVIGSALIAQRFTSPRYFWPRPSAVDFNTLASGGSNLGPISRPLVEGVNTRAAALGEGAPAALIFGSGSGLDPHLDLESAMFQVSRVAGARGLDAAALRAKVEAAVENPEYGIFGRARVNVLRLNLGLEP